MSDLTQQIDSISAEADAELAAVANSAQLEQFRIKFLGSKGAIKGLMKLLGQLPKDQKPAFGQKINALQDRVQAAFDARGAQLSAGGVESNVDITEPGIRPRIGNRHIRMKVVNELTELFGRMGFALA